MDLLGIRSLPFLTRKNYLHEFQHILFWSIPAGLVEGHFASIVVARTFLGSKLLITIATATVPASYLFSLIWGMLCVGRPKIRLMTMFIAGTALMLGSIAAIPNTSSGAIWFLLQMAAAQILFAGVVTVRSAVWKSNYPQQFRGQITARLQAIRFVTLACALYNASVLQVMMRDDRVLGAHHMSAVSENFGSLVGVDGSVRYRNPQFYVHREYARQADHIVVQSQLDPQQATFDSAFRFSTLVRPTGSSST